jgi:hypothetical protein
MNGAETMVERPSPRTPHPVQTGGGHVSEAPSPGLHGLRSLALGPHVLSTGAASVHP